MFIIIGYLVIILASVLQVYCEFGRQARPDIQPKILKSSFRFVMEGLWIFLMLLGSVALLFPGSPTNAILCGMGLLLLAGTAVHNYTDYEAPCITAVG